MICFYIGLKAKAGDFFCAQVFESIKEDGLIQREMDPDKSKLLDEMVYYSRSINMAEKSAGVKIIADKLLDIYKRNKIIIIKDECIAFELKEFWEPGLGVDFLQILNFINRIKKIIDGRCGEIKIIFALQNQVDWLLSSYSEFADRRKPASLYDFEEKILRLLEGRLTMGPFRWLYYDKVIDEIEKRFSKENSFFYCVDYLNKGSDLLIKDALSFIGINEVNDINAFRNLEFSNKRINALFNKGVPPVSEVKLDGVEVRGWLKSEVDECFEGVNARARRKIKYYF